MKTKQRTTSSYSTKTRNLNKHTIFLAVLITVALIDQIAKHLVVLNIPMGANLPLIDNFLTLTFLDNTGVSFGLFQGYNLIFVVISIIAFVYFIYIYNKKEKYYIQAAVICGGIAGNLIDRVSLGYVVDFINIRYFAVFNFADAAVSLGIIWLIVVAMKDNDDL